MLAKLEKKRLALEKAKKEEKKKALLAPRVYVKKERVKFQLQED